MQTLKTHGTENDHVTTLINPNTFETIYLNMEDIAERAATHALVLQDHRDMGLEKLELTRLELVKYSGLIIQEIINHISESETDFHAVKLMELKSWKTVEFAAANRDCRVVWPKETEVIDSSTLCLQLDFIASFDSVFRVLVPLKITENMDDLIAAVSWTDKKIRDERAKVAKKIGDDSKEARLKEYYLIAERFEQLRDEFGDLTGV
jgi:hypothetical protein